MTLVDISTFHSSHTIAVINYHFSLLYLEIKLNTISYNYTKVNPFYFTVFCKSCLPSTHNINTSSISTLIQNRTNRKAVGNSNILRLKKCFMVFPMFITCCTQEIGDKMTTTTACNTKGHINDITHHKSNSHSIPIIPSQSMLGSCT